MPCSAPIGPARAWWAIPLETIEPPSAVDHCRSPATPGIRQRQADSAPGARRHSVAAATAGPIPVGPSQRRRAGSSVRGQMPARAPLSSRQQRVVTWRPVHPGAWGDRGARPHFMRWILFGRHRRSGSVRRSLNAGRAEHDHRSSTSAAVTPSRRRTQPSRAPAPTLPRAAGPSARSRRGRCRPRPGA